MITDASVLDGRWTRHPVSRRVDADVATVWAVFENPDWLRWYKPLSDFAVVGGGDVVAGSVLREREWLWKAESVVSEWEEQRVLGLAMRAFNVPGLLSVYHRRFELTPAGDHTDVTMTGAFSFGPLGWAFLPYTYPQMMVAMYAEYRSALAGLAELVELGV